MPRGLRVLLAILLVRPDGMRPHGIRLPGVATSWPRAERDRVEAQFAEWVAAAHPAGTEMARMNWLILEPGDVPRTCRHDATRPTSCWARRRRPSTGSHSDGLALRPPTIRCPGC